MVINSEIIKTTVGVVNNKDVYFFTLINSSGDRVIISNYGGAVTSWISADKNGNEMDCVIGFNDLESYLQPHPYFGTLIGRYANRIANGKFELNGTEYNLATNNGPNHLHGGNKGFDNVVWDAEIVNEKILQLSYFSRDGEEGYPGNLKIIVTYTLTAGNELVIKYNATTDKSTPVNFTNHCYFNLSGSAANDIHNHELLINAHYITAVNENQIPTGEIMEVKGTDFDFTFLRKILYGEFDHNYILANAEKELLHAATVIERTTGKQLKLFTTEPGLQFYTGNNLDGSFINKDGYPLKKHTAFCLETQHYPDSPNQPFFPTTILHPLQKYQSVTIYQLRTI